MCCEPKFNPCAAMIFDYQAFLKLRDAVRLAHFIVRYNWYQQNPHLGQEDFETLTALIEDLDTDMDREGMLIRAKAEVVRQECWDRNTYPPPQPEHPHEWGDFPLGDE